MAQTPAAEHEHKSKATSFESFNDLNAGAARLAQGGAAIVNDTFEAGREYVGRVRDVGQNYAERVYETGNRRAEEAAFYAELGYEEARDWSRSHPTQALGIAAGIGLLIGLLVARR